MVKTCQKKSYHKKPLTSNTSGRVQYETKSKKVQNLINDDLELN